MAVIFNRMQQAVLDAILFGHNIALLGKAGTGKTFLLTLLINIKLPETTRTQPKPPESSQKRPQLILIETYHCQKITRNYSGNNKRAKRKVNRLHNRQLFR